MSALRPSLSHSRSFRAPQHRKKDDAEQQRQKEDGETEALPFDAMRARASVLTRWRRVTGRYKWS
jgi:hypothetical protein